LGNGDVDTTIYSDELNTVDRGGGRTCAVIVRKSALVLVILASAECSGGVNVQDIQRLLQHRQGINECSSTLL
jgi:hypothetical protein